MFAIKLDSWDGHGQVKNVKKKLYKVRALVADRAKYIYQFYQNVEMKSRSITI